MTGIWVIDINLNGELKSASGISQEESDALVKRIPKTGDKSVVIERGFLKDDNGNVFSRYKYAINSDGITGTRTSYHKYVINSNGITGIYFSPRNTENIRFDKTRNTPPIFTPPFTFPPSTPISSSAVPPTTASAVPPTTASAVPPPTTAYGIKDDHILPTPAKHPTFTAPPLYIGH
jgi:hypothetical protein